MVTPSLSVEKGSASSLLILRVPHSPVDLMIWQRLQSPPDMADQYTPEGASTSDASAESSGSSVELNIKTLDSQIFTFQMPVLVFKETIASKVGVPVGQQRLIFRGKVLKDNHLLSEYLRQPSEPQPSSGTNNGETNANGVNRGPEAAGAPRTRVGQVSHSVVLGTFNLGEQGEGIVPDLNRVVGAVLNSIGIGAVGTGGIQANMQFNAPGQVPQGNETGRTGGNQTGSPPQPGPQVLQIPLGAAGPIPSIYMPIPDSLNTLSEFMNRMELALSQNAYQPNQSSNSRGELPAVALPADARGLPTPEALAVVLRHAQRLLSDHAITALSRVAGRVEQERGSTDPVVRSQIQSESMVVGLLMQQIGALLLELGRTMLTLRMGRSPDESSVNAGPAVYISPAGPNPIMVQPFPLQAGSLFGGSGVSPVTPGAFGAVPRHINIHVHTAVGARTTNGDGSQGDRVNGTGSGDSGQPQVLPMRNIAGAAVPSPNGAPVSSAEQLGVTVSQPSPDSVSLSTVIAEVSSRLRNIVGNMRGDESESGQPESSAVHNETIGLGTGNDEGSNTLIESISNVVGEIGLPSSASAPGTEDQTTQPDSHQPSNKEDMEAGTSCSAVGTDNTLKPEGGRECAPRASQETDNCEGAPAVPLGLGLGGLQPKKRSKEPRSLGKSGDGATSNAPATNQDQNMRSEGQQPLLQPSGQHVSGGQFDPASAMSQVLQSPALNGLLAGVSQQTGVGSPDALRNMLGQLTQSPVMMNTVNQIAQQMEGQDLGNMFSGRGGGIDLSRMVQQMMPIVSQAFGGISNFPGQVPAVEREPPSLINERRPSRDERPQDQNSQIDLQQVAQRIEHQDPPEEVFRSVVESAVNLYDGSDAEGLVDELCTEEGLASEFMELLRRDISERLRDERGSK
ncbi:hypothetical protein RJ640_020763 [Escallonia rubra]|uniref:Ubiquitin-like domain-containing protein n=1 Tax=Escallonia rubra TaxID=112253 RepID=A0AA88S2V3_9ASTE|nr:hypothetical protein RJ640_020763 [Escallonia rubra]